MKTKTSYEIDYTSKPSSSFEDLLQQYKTSVLVIDDVLMDRSTYTSTFQDILDICKYGYEIKEIREMPIHFIFHDGDKEVLSLQLRHFLSNLTLWYGFMESDTSDILDRSYIHDFTNSNIGKIMAYMDEMILPAISDLDIYSQNKVIDEIVHNMTAISAAFLPLIGSGISIYSIYQAEKRNPEIGTIMREKIDPNLQPAEIEKELSDRTDRLIELFSKDHDNDLAPLFKSGNLLSKGQFKEINITFSLPIMVT